MTYAYKLPSSSDWPDNIALRRSPTSSDTTGRYKPTERDFLSSFYSVLRRWESETKFVSDPFQITDHPSYKALVQNAHLVLPFIIEELKLKPSQLVWVLDDAIGSSPYPEDAVGNIPEMAEAWIVWAEQNGRAL